jgi:hypothetical protein
VRLELRNTRRFVEARLKNVQSIFDYARNATLRTFGERMKRSLSTFRK